MHYSDLPEEDVTVLDGIPVTTPLRTAIDIAPAVELVELERIFDHCVARGLFTVDEAIVRLAADDMQFRPGATLLRAPIARRSASASGGHEPPAA